MAYYCKDCSYRGKTSGQLGECPACGSYNIVKRSQARKEQTSPAKWRLVVLVLLWTLFIALILRKLIL
jgi:predicted ATP-dependent serine protease